jgi:hypothetical protein
MQWDENHYYFNFKSRRQTMQTMKKKRLLITLGVSFLVAMMIGLFGLSIVSAQECRIIKINGRGDQRSIIIDPESIFVSKGDCVVWFNRFAANEIMVKFDEGKKCVDVTQSPIGFSLNEQSCYVTNYIPFAGTSSLRFMQPGTYKYMVKARSGDSWAQGSIVVK